MPCYEKLLKVTEISLKELSSIVEQGGETEVLKSIREQLQFVKMHLSEGSNPKLHLEGKKFTFGVLASRELCAPNEQALKKSLEEMIVLLRELPS